MNIQNWFPLGRTGWISLQSEGLSRVFSNTTVQKYCGLLILFSVGINIINYINYLLIILIIFVNILQIYIYKYIYNNY